MIVLSTRCFSSRSEIFDNESSAWMTFTSFMQKYNVKSTNFLQYYSLLSAIPQEWKSMPKQECLPPSTEYEPLAIENSHAKQFTILYFITSTFLPQLQREISLSAALAFKKDANLLTSFLCHK